MARCPFIEESAADIYAYKLPVFILLVTIVIICIIVIARSGVIILTVHHYQ